jgi:hypothetical protein
MASLHAINPTLVESIRDKRRLRLTHHGRERLVEPQCYGMGHTGNALLRVHQLEGGTQREPLLTVAKFSNLTVLDEHFDRAGPNCKRDDSAMKTIFAQL